MTPLGSTLRRTLVALRRAAAPSALVGGLAVSVRTEPRFTRDIDLAVAVPNDGAAEGVVRSLVGEGFLVDTLIEQDAVGRLATVRLRPSSDDGNVVDLLFASSGIETDIVAAADVLEVLPGLTLPVAQSGHLIALKLLSRDDATRPQDNVDLRALLAVADDDQQRLAATACAAITSRNFSRGRDLISALADLVGR